MKTILFCRVSSRDQEETGYSLPAQEKLLNEYSTIKNDFEISKIFAISESADGKKQRKTFNEMLEYARKHDVKVIICEKVDRLTRSLRDAVLINEWLNEDSERQVHFVKENCILDKNSKSNEKFIWNIKVSTSQYYIDNLSEEVKKGLKEKAEQGWYPSSHKRGYKTVGEAKHKTWVIDTSPESEALFIKKAFELYANNNYSPKQIRTVMFNEGWKQKNGKPVPISTIYFTLNDIFYCGKFIWRKKIFKGKHEPIISEELFERVSKKLKMKNHSKYNKHDHLFRGIIFCEECGCSITAEIQKGHTYYHCTHHRDCSQKKHTREETIDEQIYDILDEITATDTETLEVVAETLRSSHAEEIAYHNQVISGLNKRSQTLQERLDTLYIDKLAKRITLEKWGELDSKFRKEQEDTKQQIEGHKKKSLNYFELGANILELSIKARERYKENYLPDRKRRLLNIVFSNLTLKDGFVSKTYKNTFQKVSERVKTNNVRGC